MTELPKMHARAVKCVHCADGYRHIAGNCYLCGHGPAPCKFSEFEDRPLPPDQLVAGEGASEKAPRLTWLNRELENEGAWWGALTGSPPLEAKGRMH